MATAIRIPDRLIRRISEAAKKKGFAKPDDFVARIIEEKLFELEEQEKIFACRNKQNKLRGKQHAGTFGF